MFSEIYWAMNAGQVLQTRRLEEAARTPLTVLAARLRRTRTSK